MNGITIALAALVLLAPAAAADGEPEPGAEPQQDESCKFFAWTLHPEPDYRIDWDCPPLGP